MNGQGKWTKIEAMTKKRDRKVKPTERVVRLKISVPSFYSALVSNCSD